MTRAAARAASPALLAASPLLLALVPESHLPSAVAYLVHDGRPAIVFVAGLVLLASLPILPALSHAAARLEQLRPWPFAIGLAGVAFALALVVTPAARWNGDGFGGDEPKYLRLAESLLQDLDVDVKSQSQAEWTVGRFAANARRLVRDVRDAVRDVFGASADVPAGHRWNLGNWTLQGRNGGEYYVQSPGLPLLLLPGLVLREVLEPARPATFIPMLTLALLWSVAFTQTVLLASEVSGARGAGLVAGSLTAASAPLLVGGLHFYPESAAAAVIPWLLRHAWRKPTAFTAALLGLGCGFLPWLHPKFLLLALAIGALLALNLRARRLPLALLVGGAGIAVLALLLFDHHVTGLFTPDALYRRYGSAVYRGPSAFFSPMLANGLVTALFGARDGLLVIAPLLLAGALAIGVSLSVERRLTLALLSVFGGLWLAAAVHEGGAPGPPGRLMAPVACVLAALLAIGLARRSQSLGYALTTAALAALTLTITFAMFEDWRRTNNPYREMFASPARDFAKDLPDGPGRPEAPYELNKSRDRWRGVVLFLVLGFWSWWFAHHPVDAALERDLVLRRWVAAFWATLGLAAFALWALGP